MDPKSRLRTAAAIATLLVVYTLSTSAHAQSCATFPAESWELRAPSEVGLKGSKLDEVAALIGGDGAIVRDGYMVRTWGNQSLKSGWASASKPVVSTLLFFAVEEGLLDGVDDLIVDEGWPLSAKDQSMTFRHLANMLGGYTRAEGPGQAWAYNDYGIELYVQTLFDRVYAASADDVALDSQRLGILQFEDGALFDSEVRMYSSVRDVARIGWYWLNRGYWNGVQTIPRRYFDDFMGPQVPPGMPRTTDVDPAGDYLVVGSYGGDGDQTPFGPGVYGFNWWFNATGGIHPGSKSWPDAPDDAFQANGHWGREVITVIPSLRLVLTHFRGATTSFDLGNPASSTNQVMRLLVEADKPEPYLTVGKAPDGDLELFWSSVCPAFDGYGIYEGPLGDWYEHTSIDCMDDGGDSTEVIDPSPDDRYYLVVSHDSSVEGSYGTALCGAQRPPGRTTCRGSQDPDACS